MDLATEHPTLTGVARNLVATLRSWSSTVAAAPGGAVWLQHMEFGERTERLAGHLDAILHLLELGQIPSALVVARTSLEHHLLDRLLLLADRYVEVVHPDDPAQIDVWERELANRTESWTTNVLTAERTRNGRALRLVREGHAVRDEGGAVREHVSPYWAAMKHFDAFLGHPDLQSAVTRPFDSPEERYAWAKRNQQLYGGFMRWDSICSNLELSRLITAAEGIQLQVHYTFLSAYTHASDTGYDLERRRGPRSADPGHVLAELGLLYIATVARREIESWSEFVTRRPQLLEPLPPAAIDLCNEAREATSYLWLLGGRPQPIDFCDEANRRAEVHLLRGERPPQTPSDIGADELSYYPNPYVRLARLHAGEREMTTGFGFAPTWPELIW